MQKLEVDGRGDFGVPSLVTISSLRVSIEQARDFWEQGYLMLFDLLIVCQTQHACFPRLNEEGLVDSNAIQMLVAVRYTFFPSSFSPVCVCLRRHFPPSFHLVFFSAASHLRCSTRVRLSYFLYLVHLFSLPKGGLQYSLSVSSEV